MSSCSGMWPKLGFFLETIFTLNLDKSYRFPVGQPCCFLKISHKVDSPIFFSWSIVCKAEWHPGILKADYPLYPPGLVKWVSDELFLPVWWVRQFICCVHNLIVLFFSLNVQCVFRFFIHFMPETAYTSESVERRWVNPQKFYSSHLMI